jgi:hypothetical protein
LLSGTAASAFTQIGHGGTLSTGSKSGDISVVSGGNVLLQAPGSVTALAYAKIGHGDDIRLLGGGGSGNLSGDVAVSADSDITVLQGLIGHKNSFTNAAATGETWIGVSRSNPADPAGGDLLVDSLGELSGVDGLRIYVPRRQNNQIAVGAKLNGVAFTGAQSDPSARRSEDEYARFILYPSGLTQPNEHDNSLGSGPAPSVAGNFAFYYDTIEIVPPTEPVSPNVPLPQQPPGDVIPDYATLIPDDRFRDDWLEYEEAEFSEPGSTLVSYAGLPQYGPTGEPLFDYRSPGGWSEEEEDILRRFEQLGLAAAVPPAASSGGEGAAPAPSAPATGGAAPATPDPFGGMAPAAPAAPDPFGAPAPGVAPVPAPGTPPDPFGAPPAPGATPAPAPGTPPDPFGAPPAGAGTVPAPAP